MLSKACSFAQALAKLYCCRATGVEPGMDVSLDEFERRHRALSRVPTKRASVKELIWTLAISIFMTPFFWVTFFVLPMMGQITVGVAAIVTTIYFVVRRSLLIPIVALAGTALVGVVTSLIIQAVKYHVDVPLFIFLVLGVPVTTIYCLFLGGQIWSVYNPEE